MSPTSAPTYRQFGPFNEQSARQYLVSARRGISGPKALPGLMQQCDKRSADRAVAMNTRGVDGPRLSDSVQGHFACLPALIR
jgi:hypothetical protein